MREGAFMPPREALEAMPEFQEAVATYQEGVPVYLTETGQVGFVTEVRPALDGPRIRVARIGSVPPSELRLATEQDVREAFRDKMESEELETFIAGLPLSQSRGVVESKQPACP